MRLLMLSHFFEGHSGGIERVAAHICRELAAEGADVRWAASAQDAPPLDIATVPLACANPTEALTGLPMPIPGLSAVAALWREVGRADTLIIHDALYVTSILAMIMGRMRKKRRVLIQHIAAIPFASQLMRAIMGLANTLVTRPMLWAADELVFISDTVRCDLLGEPAWRAYHLVFNGVDSAVFCADGPQVSSLPGEAGKRLLFVGRFVEKKGLSILRALAEARPDLTLLLAGEGPIDPLGWGLANVHVLGRQTPRQLAELYRTADALVLPSVGEGYPLVVQEAMACGLPVVCGQPTERADPAAERWLHGVHIDLSDPAGSAARVAEATGRLAEQNRSEMATYAARTYSWPAMAWALLDMAA